MGHPLFDQHESTLKDALQAIRLRTYWSAYPEVPSGKIYGETAKADGQAAFDARLNAPFAIAQPAGRGQVGNERSPYGIDLGVTYPAPDIDALVAAATTAQHHWRTLGVDARTGVCLEILARLNRRSFEIANAVMHTSGQGFMMAFQAGGPHAQDRGLEAVAYAYEEQTRCPARITWEKKVSKTDVVRLEKVFRVIPRGVAVVVGCSTFPTWNTYPGLFASLATGNAVIIKPHPGAILPLAITVEIARAVLEEHDCDPNLVTLAADTIEAPITKELVTHERVRIIDYTGSPAFGTWIESNAPQAQVYTEKAGVNSVVLDSVENIKAVAGNLAFSISLYSGQMCTSPQNIFIPADGIMAGGETLSFDDTAAALIKSIDGLLGDDARAAEVLGAIQNQRTTDRVDSAVSEAGRVLRPSGQLTNAQYPQATVRSPAVVQVDATDEGAYMQEVFGPFVYIIKTRDTAHSIELAARTAVTCGAISGAIYSTQETVLQQAEDALAYAGVPLSCNLTGHIFVNQSAAFSDFHVSGANPSGSATLCDAAFVANRFRIVQRRTPV